MTAFKLLRTGLLLVLTVIIVFTLAAYGAPLQTLTGLTKLQRAASGAEYHEQQLPSGVRLAYLDSRPDAPADTPVILFIHGITSNKDIWLKALPHYSDYRVIAVDLPGHGNSSEPEGFDYRVENLSIQLADFVSALGLPPVHLVGNSLGGLVGGLYSADHPERVQSLVLMNSAGISAPVQSEFMARAMSDRSFNPLLVKKPEDFDLMLSAVMAEPPSLPAPIKYMSVAHTLSRLDPHSRVFNAVINDESNLDKLEPLLPQLQDKTLLMWGDSDQVFHASTVSRAQQLAPRLKAEVFEDCGHLPMLETTQQMTAELKTFFQRHRGLLATSR